MQTAMNESAQDSMTAEVSAAAHHEVLLTIRRIESGLPNLTGGARAYAETLLASLRTLLL